jgi:hypothetical protein
MTLDQFFVKLAQTPGPWFIRNNQIRTDSDPLVCPICAVLNDPRFSADWESAAMHLGLRRLTAARIAVAADNGLDDIVCKMPSLRARLIAACGLTELS